MALTTQSWRIVMLNEAYGHRVVPVSHKADDRRACRAATRESNKHAYTYCNGVVLQLSLKKDHRSISKGLVFPIH